MYQGTKYTLETPLVQGASDHNEPRVTIDTDRKDYVMKQKNVQYFSLNYASLKIYFHSNCTHTHLYSTGFFHCLGLLGYPLLVELCRMLTILLHITPFGECLHDVDMNLPYCSHSNFHTKCHTNRTIKRLQLSRLVLTIQSYEADIIHDRRIREKIKK